MLTLRGLFPKLNVIGFNNVVEVVVGSPSALLGTLIQSAYAVVPHVVAWTAGPPGAATAPTAETYHQCDAATAHVGARCCSSFVVPTEG